MLAIGGGITIRFCSRPTRWMLAASSGMDMRGVLRTLRPVGRSTSRDSGTRIRFLVGSAASSGAAAVDGAGFGFGNGVHGDNSFG
jgi:hypothetical protein